MFGVMHSLEVVVCKDAADAVAKGYDYKGKGMIPVNISKVVIVQDGTEGGNSTADLILEDESGNKFIVMVTGRLLKALPL